MENEKINVAAIIKDCPKGTEFYTTAFGNVKLGQVNSTDSTVPQAIHILCGSGSCVSLFADGRYLNDGECIIFPSKTMRDWHKFAWKKGDVLHKDGKVFVVFLKWKADDYSKFEARYQVCRENDGVTFADFTENYMTSGYRKACKTDSETVVSMTEERLGGKMNMETLEVEKQKASLEVGKRYTFEEDDEDGTLTIVGELIGLNESEDTATFGNQYEIETEKFVTDEGFELRISAHKELRAATDKEIELFNKAEHFWHCRKADERLKALEKQNQPKFKPFDKVLVRDDDEQEWTPALFVRIDETCAYRYIGLSLEEGCCDGWHHCIPYEGNEHMIYTKAPF